MSFFFNTYICFVCAVSFIWQKNPTIKSPSTPFHPNKKSSMTDQTYGTEEVCTVLTCILGVAHSKRSAGHKTLPQKANGATLAVGRVYHCTWCVLCATVGKLGWHFMHTTVTDAARFPSMLSSLEELATPQRSTFRGKCKTNPMTHATTSVQNENLNSINSMTGDHIK